MSGRLVRHGDPVGGEPVRLEVSGQDSITDEARTRETGEFFFSGVGPGDWVLRADSEEPGDFARVTYAFSFHDSDTTLVAPDLDLSLNGLEMTEPSPGETVDPPDLTNPVRFRWDQSPEGTLRAEVRVYDESGQPVWYSVETTNEEVLWNGLGNQEDYVGIQAPPGVYQWRLIVEGEGTLRFRTAYQSFEIRD